MKLLFLCYLETVFKVQLEIKTLSRYLYAICMKEVDKFYWPQIYWDKTKRMMMMRFILQYLYVYIFPTAFY